MPYPDLTDKVAIVTGGAQGVGEAVTRRLLAEGAKVTIVDLQTATCQALQDALSSPNLHAVTADVSREDDAQRYFAETIERFGRLDLFVNNAGILGPFGELKDLAIADFNAVLAVNLTGMFIGLRGAVRQMLQQGTGGSIVNISSLSAVRANTRRIAYACSKAGVVAMTKSAAVEYAKDDIRVNVILPTAIDTPMSKIVDQTRAEGGARMAVGSRPIARKARAEEIASMTAYLLSDEASFCTGASYYVDGGASA